MALTLGEGEPNAGPWRVERLTIFAQRLLNETGAPEGRPPIIAVDGRSSSGKTTLSDRLATVISGAVVVRTDDIAWWHARFDWVGLLVAGVLEPVHMGEKVSFRPPAREQRGRSGAIEVPTDATLLIIEGVGAKRRETADLIDAAGLGEVDLRMIAIATRPVSLPVKPMQGSRCMDGRGVPVPRQHRPSERAVAIVAGTPDVQHDPATDVCTHPPSRGVRADHSSARGEARLTNLTALLTQGAGHRHPLSQRQERGATTVVTRRLRGIASGRLRAFGQARRSSWHRSEPAHLRRSGRDDEPVQLVDRELRLARVRRSDVAHDRHQPLVDEAVELLAGFPNLKDAKAVPDEARGMQQES